MFVPNEIKEMHRAFAKRGKKLYIVGGAVRDFILGKTPKDYDLATDALPEETKRILESMGMSTIEVGASFGVVMTKDYEIATFRNDIGSGRRPDRVEYTTIDNDVKRRDLTINALFYDIGEEKVVDLVGGVEDLLNKVIRTVGDPDERFKEDPLRKLRALRFVASIGGQLDENTYNSLKRDPSLNGISFERIKQEFTSSILKAKSVLNYLELLEEFNYFDLIFPNLIVSKDFIEEKDYIILISFLLRENNPDNVFLSKLKSIKFTDNEAKQIKFLVSMVDFKPDDLLIRKKQQNVTDEQLAKFGKHIGKNFNKFIKFKPSVSIDEVPKDLKGKDIGDWMLAKEKEKFSMINELKRHILNSLTEQKTIEKKKDLVTESLNKVSKQFAVDNKFFGPVYHGTTPDKFEKIDIEGFRVFIDDSRTNDVRNGYLNVTYGNTGIPAPVHHLGFGVYFTTVKSNFKEYNLGSIKNMKEYYLDVPRLEIINFGSPKNMMKWWVENGYDPEIAKRDRIQATVNLTNSLKEKYDAIWFKGKGLYKLLDGDQVVIFNPDRIYMVDPKLSSGREIGAKIVLTKDIYGKSWDMDLEDYVRVIKIKAGVKGVIKGVRDSGHGFKYYDITFKPGGTQYNIREDEFEPLK